MTDRFEEAVRDAVQGLPSISEETPTYHDAWHRGRRRRLIKRSAMAAAGVVVLFAALTVNLGRIPGSGTAEVDDVATGFDQATTEVEPTALATTAPIETADPTATVEVASLDTAEPAAGEPTPDPAAASASEPAPTATPVQAPTPVATPVPVQPAPTAVAPDPTAVPTSTPAPREPTAVPTPDSAQAAETDASDPQEPGFEAQLPTETDPGEAAGTAQQPPDPGSPDEPQTVPEPAFTTPAAAADAVILGGAARGTALPCDFDGDGVADAYCQLLGDYACTGNGDVRPGYTPVDANGDQINDTCVAMDITLCDTALDGVGDTPCIIELMPASSNSEPADEDVIPDG